MQVSQRLDTGVRRMRWARKKTVLRCAAPSLRQRSQSYAPRPAGAQLELAQVVVCAVKGASFLRVGNDLRGEESRTLLQSLNRVSRVEYESSEY